MRDFPRRRLNNAANRSADIEQGPIKPVGVLPSPIPPWTLDAPCVSTRKTHTIPRR